MKAIIGASTWPTSLILWIKGSRSGCPKRTMAAAGKSRCDYRETVRARLFRLLAGLAADARATHPSDEPERTVVRAANDRQNEPVGAWRRQRAGVPAVRRGIR